MLIYERHIFKGLNLTNNIIGYFEMIIYNNLLGLLFGSIISLRTSTSPSSPTPHALTLHSVSLMEVNLDMAKRQYTGEEPQDFKHQLGLEHKIPNKADPTKTKSKTKN